MALAGLVIVQNGFLHPQGSLPLRESVGGAGTGHRCESGTDLSRAGHGFPDPLHAARPSAGTRGEGASRPARIVKQLQLRSNPAYGEIRVRGGRV